MKSGMSCRGHPAGTGDRIFFCHLISETVKQLEIHYRGMRVEGLHPGIFQNIELTIYFDRIIRRKK